MKDLEVRFETGREVLNAYWGYLSDGGLIIPDQGLLAVGDPVALSVRIESSRATYALSGKVVRCDAATGRAVIAFSPGEPQDMLLTQALADAEHVPARRARRFRVTLDARVLDATSALNPARKLPTLRLMPAVATTMACSRSSGSSICVGSGHCTIETWLLASRSAVAWSGPGTPSGGSPSWPRTWPRPAQRSRACASSSAAWRPEPSAQLTA